MRIVNHAYNNSVEVVFDTSKHQYTYNGQVIPGATTILGVLSKPALIFWASNMASDYFKSQIVPGVALDEVEIERIWQQARKAHTQKKLDSATLGSMVHKYVEQYIKGENPPMPVNPEMKGACERFLQWVQDHQVKFLVSEQMVFSKKHLYAGTTDFICKIDGRLWIGDLKTSQSVYSEYFAQTSAYLEARTEEFPTEKFDGAVIVRVGKEDGDFEAVSKTREELAPHFELFLNCLAVYKSLKKLEVKNA